MGKKEIIGLEIRQEMEFDEKSQKSRACNTDVITNVDTTNANGIKTALAVLSGGLINVMHQADHNKAMSKQDAFVWFNNCLAGMLEGETVLTSRKVDGDEG